MKYNSADLHKENPIHACIFLEKTTVKKCRNVGDFFTKKFLYYIEFF